MATMATRRTTNRQTLWMFTRISIKLLLLVMMVGWAYYTVSLPPGQSDNGCAGLPPLHVRMRDQNVTTGRSHRLSHRTHRGRERRPSVQAGQEYVKMR